MQAKTPLWAYVCAWLFSIAVIFTTVSVSWECIHTTFSEGVSDARKENELSKPDSGLISAPVTQKPKSDPVNDAIAAAALVGSWSYVSDGVGTLYKFGADGTFGEYTVISINTTYIGSDGWYYTRSSGAYNFFTKGRYRIRGGVIELYDCIKASQSAYDTEWFHDSGNNRNDAMDKLMTMPLTLFEPADDSTLEYEFYDTGRLRVRAGETDNDYNRDSEQRTDVKVPDVMIPEAEWPVRALSPDMPEFEGEGRIRSVKTGTGDPEDTPDEYRTYYINVYRTNPEAARLYIKELESAGWTVTEDIADWPSARKGLYWVDVNIYEDYFRITASKDREGQWPSNWVGTEIYPPENVIIIGEIDASEWGQYENIHFTIKCDNVDAAGMERYIGQLKNDGFADAQDTFNLYEVYKFLKINGSTYRVYVEAQSIVGSVSDLRYTFEYLAPGIWKGDIPNGFLPPENANMYGDLSVNEYSTFYFDAAPMDDAKAEQYFKMLEQEGWILNDWFGKSAEKTVNWYGRQYDMSIAYYGSYDGLASFKVFFEPHEDEVVNE